MLSHLREFLSHPLCCCIADISETLSSKTFAQNGFFLKFHQSLALPLYKFQQVFLHSKAVLSSVRWRQESQPYRVLYREMHVLWCFYRENLMTAFPSFKPEMVTHPAWLQGLTWQVESEWRKDKHTDTQESWDPVGWALGWRSCSPLEALIITWGCGEHLQWIISAHWINIYTWTIGVLCHA